MKLFTSKPFRWGAGFTFLVFVSAVYGFHALSESRMNALFEGPCVLSSPQETNFYPRVNYNLSEYTLSKNAAKDNSNDSMFATRSRDEDLPWVDGAALDEVESVMRQYASQNAGRNGNAALDKLQSPSIYKDKKPAKSLQVCVPSNGAVYPPNLCAPFIEWDDPRNNVWRVSIRIEGSDREYTFISKKKSWRVPKNVWKSLCARPDEKIILQVRGIVRGDNNERFGDIQASPEIHFTISSDPADDYIVYRLVDPPFSSFKTPNIFVRDIRKDEPDSFLSARRQYCLNCHTFSSKEGNKGKLAMQVRSLVTTMHKLPVYVAIYDMDKDCGYKVQLPFEIQMTTFMAWSPDSEKLAYSANQKVAAMKPITFETQLAGMATSDIAIYDVEKNETWLVPGASDPNKLEIYPRWTPDGKSLVYSRSPVGQHPSHILYNLYQVNLEGDPVAQPIEGAANNGRSNYYPRFSPDRKWFSYCQCDGGDLIRSSSDLFLKPANLKGPSHKLECNVDYAADSWHSWSSSSRWIVFASKRDGGIYAYLYMTHIDENGHASPAVPLPMMEKPFASYNIPEFIANVPQVKDSELFDSIRTETKPRLAQLRKTSQGNRNAQKEKGGEI